MVELLRSISPGDAPEGASMTRDFLMRLSRKFVIFRAHVLNNENAHIAAMPTPSTNANIFMSGYDNNHIQSEVPRAVYSAGRPSKYCQFCKSAKDLDILPRNAENVKLFYFDPFDCLIRL
jgi:hypothetical protein